MFPRTIESYISDLLDNYRCITIVGPRQSGKTTLSRKLFSEFEYYTFESPDLQSRVELDPRSFLRDISSAILDEVQKVPDLISYIQEILDDPSDTRKLVLTGSNAIGVSIYFAPYQEAANGSVEPNSIFS